MFLPKSIENFVKVFSSFPSIGQKQATRLAFYLINQKSKLREARKSLEDLERNIIVCSECFMPFQSSASLKSNVCPICLDRRRNRKIICLVEKETDLLTIEESKKYNGLYFILGGEISPVDPESYKKIRINPLIKKIRRDKIEEVIIATSLTTAGDLTAMYVERSLKNLGVKITRLGRGIPTGGEIEFADPETIAAALKRRE